MARWQKYWQEFALTFPGYDLWGVTECQERANLALDEWKAGKPPTGSLTELRALLFCEQRRAHFTNGWGDPHTYPAYLIEAIGDQRSHDGDSAEDPPRIRSAFPASPPSTAEEARSLDWPLLSYNVPNRFRLLETSAMGPEKTLCMAEERQALSALPGA